MNRRIVSSMCGWCLIAMCLGALSGCETLSHSTGKAFHELKPHRLARWNQGPGPNSTANFSVDDPIPELETDPQALLPAIWE